MEAFIVAFRVPNFIRKIFAEGAITQASVPLLKQHQHNKHHLQIIIRQLSTYIAAFGIILSLAGIIFSGIWIILFAPGFYNDPSQFMLTRNLLVIMLPYVFFMLLAAFFHAILNAFERFYSAAFIPCILNIAMIVALVISQKHHHSIYIVAWGVLLAGVIQCVIQIPLLWRLKLSLTPIFKRPITVVKKALFNLTPAILGASVVQISILLDTIFASFLVTGSLPWLYYADRLTQFPLGIFGVALATVILPKITQHKGRTSITLNAVLNWGLKLTFLLSIPAAIAMALLAFPLIISLFQYDAFSRLDATHSSYALIIFSLALIPFILIKVLISAIYAQNHTRKAVRIAITCLLVNIVSNTLLVALFYQSQLGYLSLAISTAITAILNSGLLFYVLKKEFHFKINNQLWQLIGKIIIASTIMAILLYIAQGSSSNWFNYSFHQRLSYLCCLICLGIATYFSTLFMLGVRFNHIKSECQ